MIVNNSEQLSLHTNAILELWLELQIHYMKYTRNVRGMFLSSPRGEFKGFLEDLLSPVKNH